MTPLSLMIQLIVFASLSLGSVYFLFYRPTVGQQNRQRRVVAGLRNGDEVVTTSGFIARVVDILEPDDGTVEILLDLGGVTIRARPNAIADRLPRADESEPGVPAVEAQPAQGAESDSSEAEGAAVDDALPEPVVAAPPPRTAARATGRARQRGKARV